MSKEHNITMWRLLGLLLLEGFQLLRTLDLQFLILLFLQFSVYTHLRQVQHPLFQFLHSSVDIFLFLGGLCCGGVETGFHHLTGF